MVVAHQAPSAPTVDEGRITANYPHRRYVSPEDWLREHPGTFGRTLFYEMLQANRLPHVRVKRKYLVPSDLLDLLLAKQLDGTADSPASAA